MWRVGINVRLVASWSSQLGICWSLIPSLQRGVGSVVVVLCSSRPPLTPSDFLQGHSFQRFGNLLESSLLLFLWVQTVLKRTSFAVWVCFPILNQSAGCAVHASVDLCLSCCKCGEYRIETYWDGVCTRFLCALHIERYWEHVALPQEIDWHVWTRLPPWTAVVGVKPSTLWNEQRRGRGWWSTPETDLRWSCWLIKVVWTRSTKKLWIVNSLWVCSMHITLVDPRCISP